MYLFQAMLCLLVSACGTPWHSQSSDLRIWSDRCHDFAAGTWNWVGQHCWQGAAVPVTLCHADTQKHLEMQKKKCRWIPHLLPNIINFYTHWKLPRLCGLSLCPACRISLHYSIAEIRFRWFSDTHTLPARMLTPRHDKSLQMRSIGEFWIRRVQHKNVMGRKKSFANPT
jgi:hypothetical protein